MKGSQFPIKLQTIPSGKVRSHKESNFLFDPKINQLSTNLTPNTSLETLSTPALVFLPHNVLLLE
jgi:hypothetical protein